MASTSITNFSATNFYATEEPLGVIGAAGAKNIAPPSDDVQFSSIGSTDMEEINHGRNEALLEKAFPAATLGLESYDPLATFELLMAGNKNLVFGQANTARAAEAYLGGGYVDNASINPGGVAGHLSHAAAPDLTDVNDAADTHGVFNAYVPNIAGPRAATDDMRSAYFDKYPGERNSFPPKPSGGGLDLNASDTNENASLNPAATVNRLGGWTHDTLTLGRWKSNTSD